MNKNVIFAFVSGALIGGFVTYRYLTAKIQDSEEDKTDVTYVTAPPKKFVKEEDAKNEPVTKPSSSISKESMEQNREFTDYVNAAKNYKEPEPVKDEREKPYVIDPVELGDSEDEEYVVSELMYYADGILADESDSVIEIDDIEMFIGMESLEHFGEFEPDSVAVRNPRLKVDYLILRSNRDYADVENELPPSKRRKGLDD